MAERRKDARSKRRLTAHIETPEGTFSGIVRDLSASGLFVQTRVSLKPGQKIRVELRESDGREFAISAKVVRRYVVPSRLSSIASSGVALQIEKPSEAFLQLVARQPSPAVAAPAPASPSVPGKSPSLWRIKANQTGKPRTRTIKVEAIDEESAREAAKLELGEGWEILEATED
ncbi:MAG: PilZ domain-containing protein [Deltaproteobacteria bacterium]|nr:PilZ domain-containing protein [Deltaproteobacteria bacterium]